MEKIINEELRQFKLFKIQETESKLRRFQNTYSEIKEHLMVKISKNVTSNLFRVIFILLGVIALIITLICFFPEYLIEIFKSNGEYITMQQEREMIEECEIDKYIFLLFTFLLFFSSYLLKLNIKKRSSIYSLSKLLEEVMDYMENSAFEDKRKYEYFVDSIAEKEKKK